MEHTICAQVIACKVFYIYICTYVERTHTYVYIIVANLHFFAQYYVDNTETERDVSSQAVCAKSSQKQKWKQVERERQTTFRCVLGVFNGEGVF